MVRAHIILAAADGRSNAAIAAHLRLHVDTVRKWRRRFHQQRLAGLTDRPRSGRPRRFSAVQVAEVKALACELPADADIPLAKWSCPELAAEASRRGVVASISASTVRRWLAADAISFFTVRGPTGEPLKVLLLSDHVPPAISAASIAAEVASRSFQ